MPIVDRESRLESARRTADELVTALEEGKTPIDACLMKAARLARLLRDSDAQKWLQLETTGYPSAFASASLGSCEQYAKLARFTADGKYWTQSLPELEAALIASEAHVKAPPPIAPLTPVEDFTAANATEKLIGTQQLYRTKREEQHQRSQRLFSSLKSAVHAFASQMLIALELGDAVGDLVEGARGEVDVFIRANCPQAAEQLIAVNDRLRDGDSESLTAALTSCRRLLKTVADAVFPSRSEPYQGHDGKPRKVGNDEYKNRLLAYLEQRLSSQSSQQVASSALEHLASRLDAVYEKTCKGVHDAIAIEEARLAVIHTYLFVAEIARASRLGSAE